MWKMWGASLPTPWRGLRRPRTDLRPGRTRSAHNEPDHADCAGCDGKAPAPLPYSQASRQGSSRSATVPSWETSDPRRHRLHHTGRSGGEQQHRKEVPGFRGHGTKRSTDHLLILKGECDLLDTSEAKGADREQQ